MTIDEILTSGRDFREYQSDMSAELEVLRSMLIHSQKADPTDVIIKRHPSEDEATFNWRLDNYTCITKPIFDKACNALNRIFADTTADWNTSNNTEMFLTEKRFSGARFDNFFQKYVIRTMLEDPNAWLVTHPHLPTPDSDNVKIDVDMSVVKTTHQFHKSRQAIIWCEESIYDINKPRTLMGSILQYNRFIRRGDIPINAYYHIVTPTEYAIIYLQKSDNSSKTIPKLVSRYDHLTGDLLYTPLGGKMTIDGHYESYFASFVEFGNEALKQFSDYQLIMKNCAYPIKEMRAMDCTAEGCKAGWIYGEDNIRLHKCSSCGGTGRVIYSSPSSVLIRPEVGPGESVIDTTPMLQYHYPDTSILEYAEQAWIKLLDMALNALNLNFVLEAQSGVAKALDRQELYSMVAEIGHNVYDSLIYDVILRIEKLRERQYATEPIIIKPSHYNIDTEDRLNEQFMFFSQVKGTDFIKIETVRRNMQRMHSGNPKMLKIVEVLIQIDSLLTLSIDEIATALVMGAATEFDAFINRKANASLSRMIYKKEQERKEMRKRGDAIDDYLMSTPVVEIVDDLREHLLKEFVQHKLDLQRQALEKEGGTVIDMDMESVEEPDSYEPPFDDPNVNNTNATKNMYENIGNDELELLKNGLVNEYNRRINTNS